jgi:thiol-disulfide isomerase/thioredoxin
MKYIIQLVLTLMLPLCSLAGNGFVIKGRVTGIISGYASVIKNGVDVAPKVRIVNGEFTYEGKIDHPEIVTLKISTRQVSIFLENTSYELNCSLDSLTSEQVKGGTLNGQLLAYRKAGVKPFEYLKTHGGEEIASWIANFYMESRADAEIAEQLLSPTVKANYYGQQFMSKMETFRRTAPGTLFPSLKMTDVKGKPFTSKDMAGKVVVFDYWASWCAPCIAYIPKLRAHYKNFKDQDVLFVSVSVDEDTNKWKAAMTEQGMEWQQVLAEGAFKNGEGIRKLFNITGIPYVIIVDKEGKIAASLDYKGKENLAAELDRILKQ